MNFSEGSQAFLSTKRDIFNDVKTHHAEYIDKMGVGYKESRGSDDIEYIGCGSINNNHLVYLAFITTLPVFERMSSAKDCLLQHLAWTRRFENYKLGEHFNSSRKIIKFFSHAPSIPETGGAQAFIFRPEQLDRLVAIVQKTLPQKKPEEIVKDILHDGHTDSHRIIFEMAVKKLNEEKNIIVNENWTKAKSAIASFKIVKFIKLLWENFTIKKGTRDFEKELRKVNDRFSSSLGPYKCGMDTISTVCQIKGAGPFPNPFLKS